MCSTPCTCTHRHTLLHRHALPHTVTHYRALSRITASSQSSHASHTHRRTHSETYWIPRASFELYRAYFKLTTSLLRSELQSPSSLPSSLPNSLGNSECHVDTSNMYIKSIEIEQKRFSFDAFFSDYDSYLNFRPRHRYRHRPQARYYI